MQECGAANRIRHPILDRVGEYTMHAPIQHVVFEVYMNTEALGDNQVNRIHHTGTPHFPREEKAITKVELFQNRTLGAKGLEGVIAATAPPGALIGGDHINGR